MKDNKAISLLKEFTKEELQSFDKFLASPYFNKNEDVRFTFQIVVKYISAIYQKRSLEEYIQNAYQKKSKAIGIPGIKKHLTIIVKLAYQFISYEGLKNNSVQQQLNILRSYFLKNNKEAFLKLYPKLKNKIILQKDDISKYKELHDLEELNWFFNSNITDTRTGDANLENKNAAFNKYFLSEKLWTSIAILSRQNQVRSEIQMEDIDQLLLKVEDSVWLQDHFIMALYISFNMLSKPSQEKEKYFNDLILHLDLYSEQFEKSKTYNFYNLVRAEAKRIYTKKNDLYLFLFELYKKQIKNKSIYNNKKIHFGIFKNIVTVGIKLKEFDWLENFIEINRDLILPEKISEDICIYSLARIYFFKKDFKQANEYLISDRLKDPYYKISMKRLNLMLFFENKEWLVLDSMIKSFKVSLSKNRTIEINELNRIYENNFLNFFHRLYKVYIDVNQNKSRYENLKKELIKQEQITEKEWLMEKVCAAM